MIAAPLTDMTVVGVKVNVKGEALEAFEQIKSSLSSAPILHQVDYLKPFLLQTDVSKVVIGAILSQKDDSGCKYVIGYGSKKLNPAQQKWDTCEQEAFAVL